MCIEMCHTNDMSPIGATLLHYPRFPRFPRFSFLPRFRTNPAFSAPSTIQPQPRTTPPLTLSAFSALSAPSAIQNQPRAFSVFRAFRDSETTPRFPRLPRLPKFRTNPAPSKIQKQTYILPDRSHQINLTTTKLYVTI